jgi:hypothetical protein
LTFNSTSLHDGLLREAGFVERTPLRPIQEKRRIFLIPEIDHFLTTNDPYFPRATAEATMLRFRAGFLITVSRKMGVHKPDLEKLVGPDEVWVLCFRSPRPGGRLLGRFLEKDIFVGLGIYLREDLGGAEYELAAANAVNQWAALLGPAQPIRSDDLDDYISATYRDMDDDDE